MKKASARAYRQQPLSLKSYVCPRWLNLKEATPLDASLVFQSWLKDIWVYTIEHCLSQLEAIQLVKDYTSEQARSEVEYYLGLTPKQEQSFQGLIDHLSLAFQSCETVSSLIADFYNQCQRTRETEDAFAWTNCRSWSGKSLQGNWNLFTRQTRH